MDQTIHMPNNALLAHEILAAAEYAEQGMTASELSDMAQRGEFEGGPRQNVPTEGFHSNKRPRSCQGQSLCLDVLISTSIRRENTNGN